MRKRNLVFWGALLIWATVSVTGAWAAPGLFPTTLLDNTTGKADAYFIGAPDDSHWGLGGTKVTYDFGTWRVINGAGQDFNVYEVDWGSPEFSLVDVLVSANGTNFFSVKGSEQAVVRIDGDSVHSHDNYARSYDLFDSGLSEIRYIRLQGLSGDTTPGQNSGFDPDAIGAINYKTTAVPLPSALFLLASGLAGLGVFRKRIR